MKDTVIIKVEISRAAAELLANLDWEDESLKKLSKACKRALSPQLSVIKNNPA
jgi:hypothetical protein